MTCFLLFRTASPCHHYFTSFQRWEQQLLLFSCCFCVYGLGCKFDMTISYVETRNGLPIFWACFRIYYSPLCTYIFIDMVFCLFVSFSAPLARASQCCPHWQRPPLHCALHLKPGTTISVQNAPSILPSQVPISDVLTLLFVTHRTAAFFFYAAYIIPYIFNMATDDIRSC